MTDSPQPSTFAARLAELHAAATSDDYTFAANWNLIVYLRNHTEAILALVGAATEVVEGWAEVAYEEMPELGRCRAALEALNG